MDALTCEPASWVSWAPTPLHRHQSGLDCVIDDEFRTLCQSLLQADNVDATIHVHGTATASPTPASPSDLSAGMLLPYPKHTSDSGKEVTMLPAAPPPLSASPQQQPQEQLDEGVAKLSHREVRIETKEAEKRILALARSHAKAETENSRLKALEKKLSACVQITDFQMQLTDAALLRGPRRPAPLPASCSQVSFASLPPSSQWDASWVARIKALQPLDLLVLRRQWAQQSGVLLPQAQVYGPSSEPYKTMERLHEKYVELVQLLLALAPQVWLESSQYDTDTLQPVAPPSAEWLRDLLVRYVPHEVLPGLHNLGAEYNSTSSSLQGEYRTLLQRYKSLAQELSTQQPLGSGDAAGAAGAWDGRFGFGAASSQLASVTQRLRLDYPPAYLERLQQLEDTANLLQANSNRQKVALLKLFSMMHPRFNPDNFHFVLMMYPFACTSVDFVPSLLLLGDTATAAAQNSPLPDPMV